MVEASNSQFRFRFAPNSLGSSGLGARRGTNSLMGNHDRGLLSYLIPSSNSRVSGVSHMYKRSYADLQCRGIYDASIFARLERVCEDCYNLYKDDEILGLCRYVQLVRLLQYKIKKKSVCIFKYQLRIYYYILQNWLFWLGNVQRMFTIVTSESGVWSIPWTRGNHWKEMMTAILHQKWLYISS